MDSSTVFALNVAETSRDITRRISEMFSNDTQLFLVLRYVSDQMERIESANSPEFRSAVAREISEQTSEFLDCRMAYSFASRYI